MTFTNKSATGMRQCIHQLTGDNSTGYINTFHGFCVSILQEDSHTFQYPRSFLVLDNGDIDAMLQVIYDDLCVPHPDGNGTVPVYGGRSYDGSPWYPSRFLLDIDQALLTFTLPPQEGLIQECSIRWMPEYKDDM